MVVALIIKLSSKLFFIHKVNARIVESYSHQIELFVNNRD